MADEEIKVPVKWLHEETFSPSAVAKTFGVDPRTITKWAKNGVIGFFRTPSGLRRYPLCEVERLVAGDKPEDQQLLLDLAAKDAERYRDRYRPGWMREDKGIPIKQAEGNAE
jgi:hypothetical protein